MESISVPVANKHWILRAWLYHIILAYSIMVTFSVPGLSMIEQDPEIEAISSNVKIQYSYGNSIPLLPHVSSHNGAILSHYLVNEILYNEIQTF